MKLEDSSFLFQIYYISIAIQIKPNKHDGLISEKRQYSIR